MQNPTPCPLATDIFAYVVQFWQRVHLQACGSSFAVSARGKWGASFGQVHMMMAPLCSLPAHRHYAVRHACVWGCIARHWTKTQQASVCGKKVYRSVVVCLYADGCVSCLWSLQTYVKPIKSRLVVCRVEHVCWCCVLGACGLLKALQLCCCRHCPSCTAQHPVHTTWCWLRMLTVLHPILHAIVSLHGLIYAVVPMSICRVALSGAHD